MEIGKYLSGDGPLETDDQYDGLLTCLYCIYVTPLQENCAFSLCIVVLPSASEKVPRGILRGEQVAWKGFFPYPT